MLHICIRKNFNNSLRFYFTQNINFIYKMLKAALAMYYTFNNFNSSNFISDLDFSL